MGKNRPNVYITPLGEFRGELKREPHPAWVLIHRERVARGWDIGVMGEAAGIGGSTVSKGERGGSMGLETTLKALKVFGYTLELVKLPEGGEAQ